jgi:hypothetical protein
MKIATFRTIIARITPFTCFSMQKRRNDVHTLIAHIYLHTIPIEHRFWNNFIFVCFKPSVWIMGYYFCVRYYFLKYGIQLRSKY